MYVLTDISYLNIFLHCYYFFLFYRSPFYFLICQVAIEVEREEDEGGMAGETFTDYVSILFLDHS